jgi:hypothetical protein
VGGGDDFEKIVETSHLLILQIQSGTQRLDILYINQIT